MKKIIFSFLAFSIIGFTSCERALDDVYDELGDVSRPEITAENSYVLEEGDYEDMKVDGEFFNSLEDARNLIPAFLDDKYPNLDDGSLTLVTFDLNVGVAIEDYKISDSDYDGLRTNNFVNNSSDPITGFEKSIDEDDLAEYLATILDQNIESIDNEDIYNVAFNYFEVTSVVLDNYYDVDIRDEDVYNSFEKISVTGDQVWEYSDRYGAVVSGFDSGTDFENEDWLISPEIDLTIAADASITVSQAMNFLSGEDRNKILISTDYTTGGDFNTATWNEIVFETKPEGNSWSFVQSELVSIDSYVGETIHLAFVYDYLDGDTPTWEVGNITIQPTTAEEFDYVYEESSMLLEYSEASAEWTLQDVVELVDEDYDSMGESSGQPGRFNNFSSSTPADSYLPTFLELKNPFAMEGDKILVKYKFFQGNTIEIIDSYQLIENVWTLYSNVITESIQFGKVNGIWEPDNTITYTLSTPTDYDFIGEELLTTEGFESAADNVAFFHSFERRETDGEFWSNEMLLTGFALLLDELDPNAEIGQKYSLTFTTYIGSTSSEIFNLIKNEDGEWIDNNEE